MNLIKITLPEDGVEKLINQCGIEFFMHDLASFKSLYKKGLFPQRILIELLKEELNENNMKYILFVLSSKKSVDYSSYTPLDALLDTDRPNDELENRNLIAKILVKNNIHEISQYTALKCAHRNLFAYLCEDQKVLTPDRVSLLNHLTSSDVRQQLFKHNHYKFVLSKLIMLERHKRYIRISYSDVLLDLVRASRNIADPRDITDHRDFGNLINDDLTKLLQYLIPKVRNYHHMVSQIGSRGWSHNGPNPDIFLIIIKIMFLKGMNPADLCRPLKGNIVFPMQNSVITSLIRDKNDPRVIRLLLSICVKENTFPVCLNSFLQDISDGYINSDYCISLIALDLHDKSKLIGTIDGNYVCLNPPKWKIVTAENIAYEKKIIRRTRLDVIKDFVLEKCIGLAGLRLPTLMVLAIIDEMNIPVLERYTMYEWLLIDAVRAFVRSEARLKKRLLGFFTTSEAQG